jgi:post-segregation antitoxin (ccd killing protein)
MGNTQLPAEVEIEISAKADAIFENMKEHAESEWDVKYAEGFAEGWADCATEYASKLHRAQQEIEQLKGWKMEAAELLAQIHAYVHKNMEVSLGRCHIKAVINRCKQFEQASALLEKLVSNQHVFILPEQIENEIKTFLDGTK